MVGGIRMRAIIGDPREAVPMFTVRSRWESEEGAMCRHRDLRRDINTWFDIDR